jgi:hypothetical protein
MRDKCETCESEDQCEDARKLRIENDVVVEVEIEECSEYVKGKKGE